MTKILREVIGGREPTFSTRIKQLELSTGSKTLDIELTAEMLSRLSDVIKKLKLDPLDTTSEELYVSLILKAKEHDEILRNSYHGKIKELIRAINHHKGVVQIPVIKSSVIRQIIGEIPPKKVMSALGYRSAASLLKRADINQVLVGAFILESVTWHRAFSKRVKQCKISDITLENPKVIIVDKKLLRSNSSMNQLPYVQFAGVVGVSGINAKKAGGWLEIAARSADGLFHVHQRGIYLKLSRFQNNIIKKLVDLTYVAPVSVTKVASVRVPWASVYTYISNNLDEIIFADESSVEKSDFRWKGSIEVLKNVHQQLDFWNTTTIVAKPTASKPVSLNLSDIAFNALHGVSYDERSCANIARNTLEELLSRYFKHYTDKEEALKSIGLYA